MGRDLLEASHIQEHTKEELQGNEIFEIKLLGTPFLVHSSAVVIIPRKRERALFYFLAAENGGKARSVLLRIFWGDQSSRSANHSLSNAIYRINKFFRKEAEIYPVLICDNETVYLNKDFFEVDLSAFEAWAVSLDFYPRKRLYDRNLLLDLERTVTLYRGEFMEGLYLENVEEFEEWIFFKRERYGHIYQKMLQAIVQQLSLIGEYEEALDYALKVLHQDPMSEEYHSMVMMLYWKLGNKGAVIRQYDTYKETIGERLGLEPSSEMRALFYKMVQQFPSHASLPKDLSEMVAVPVEDEMKGNLFKRQGLVLFDISQYSGAFAKFKKALEFADKTDNLRLRCYCLYHLGMAKLWGHEVEDAEYYLAAGYELSKNLKDHPTTIGCAVNLALVYGLKGKLAESKRLSEEALRLKDFTPDSWSRYEVLMDVSRRFLWKGDPKSAINGFKEALRLAQTKGRRTEMILSHLFLGLAYGTFGNFGMALENLYTGYEKAKEIANTFLLAKILNSIGWIYQELGDFENALPWDQAAVNLARDNGWPEPLGYSLINLGIDYFKQQNDAMARETFKEAVELAVASNYQWRWLGALWLAKSEFELDAGNIEQALADRVKADGLTGQVRGQKHSAKLDLLNGRIQFALGNDQLAEKYIQKAIVTAEYSGNPLTVVDACNAAGVYYRKCSNLDNYRLYAKKSEAKIEEVATRLNASLKRLFLNSPRVKLTRELLEL
ncbi:MAG: tetratricopeptide repeat protein [Desulfitobacteriaceae bacterium]